MNVETLTTVRANTGKILRELENVDESRDYSKSYADILEVIEIINNNEIISEGLAENVQNEICCIWMILAKSTSLMYHRSHQSIHDYINLSIKSWRNGLKYAARENKMDCLKGCAMSLLGRNEVSMNVLDLNQAVILLDELLYLVPDGHTSIPEILNLLGTALRSRYQCTGNIEDLGQAIHSIRKAAELLSEGHDDTLDILDNLGNTLENRFDSQGDIEDLEEVIQIKRKLITLTPEGHSEMPGRMTNLGNSLQSKFERIGDIQYLEDAINIRIKSLEIAADGNHNIPRILSNLGNSLQALFSNKRNMKDLDEAILVYRQSIELISAEHPDRAKMLNNLGSALTTQFQTTGRVNMEILEQVIHYNKKSIELLPNGHSDIPELLQNLSNSLMTKFEIIKEVDCLHEAINNQTRAVGITPDSHPDMPGRLYNLGIALHMRFHNAGNMDDLEKAADYITKSVEFTPRSQYETANRLSSLGIIFLTKFNNTGNMENLEYAVKASIDSVELVPKGHPQMLGILSNLGSALLAQFDHTGHSEDLEKVIDITEKVVKLTPDDHIDMPGRLSKYSNALLTRFEHTANMADLQHAIHANERAIEITPEGHPEMHRRWGVHGHALIKRFEVEGNTEDLDQAIFSYQRSIQLNSEGHSEIPGKLTNLSIALQMRFNHRANIDDLEQAIFSGKRAVELTPEYHSDFPSMLNNLGTALQFKFDYTRNVIDLEEVVIVKKRCVRLVTEGHPLMPQLLNNLGKTLQIRFDILGEKTDLTNALAVCIKALNLLPDGHPLKIMCHCSTGTILNRLGSFEQDTNYIHHSSVHFKMAITNTAYPPHTRLYAAQLWGSQYPSLQQSDEILDAFSIAFNLLPQVIPFTYTVGHRYDRLKVIQGLSIAACAIATIYGQYKRAVEWSDQGRGIFWMQIHHLRSPIEDVHEVNPHLADKLRDISLRLQMTTDRAYTSNTLASRQEMINLETETRRHQSLIGEWEYLVRQARSYVGLENLLMPSPFSEMVKYIPTAGKVIIVNVGRVSSDALVLSNDITNNIVHIPLPMFSLDIAEALRRLLYSELSSSEIRTREARAGRPATSARNGKMCYILSTLWFKVVVPIFKIIGILSFPSPIIRQRIWWCPTGPLTFLPIHAAGVYENDVVTGSMISDYAISSYIPTVSALMNSRRHRYEHKTFQGMLVVSQENYPGLPELPATVSECKAIQEEFTNKCYAVRHVDGKEATHQNVLALMERYNWIHLSCHGSQDLQKPINSAFYLHGDKLTLLNIIQKNIPNADFAFLSACQTASGSPELSSEAIHLAAGMLAAGYRSVVATMWSICDDHALFVTKTFYQYLVANIKEGEVPDSSQAADALQYATSMLREELGTSDEALMTWVPYVHIGL